MHDGWITQIICCAAVGSFLVALGVDLILERQAGWSFALRFMFDRNNSHFLVRAFSLPLLISWVSSCGLVPDVPISCSCVRAHIRTGYRP